MKPLLFHFHGINGIDFSSLVPEQLDDVQAAAARRGWDVQPTVYLRRDYIDRFAEVMHAYRVGRADGRYGSIVGFALEGPLLGPGRRDSAGRLLDTDCY
jgi:N-acetylglucosamine-6-phosphate deacetylase